MNRDDHCNLVRVIAELEAIEEFAPPPGLHKRKLDRALSYLREMVDESSKKYEGRRKEQEPKSG